MDNKRVAVDAEDTVEGREEGNKQRGLATAATLPGGARNVKETKRPPACAAATWLALRAHLFPCRSLSPQHAAQRISLACLGLRLPILLLDLSSPPPPRAVSIRLPL